MTGRRLARYRLSASAIAVSTVALVACTPGAETTAGLPPSPPTFYVAIREYGFDHAPQAPLGRVLFRAENVGEMDHELTLVRLAPDQQGTVSEVLLSLQATATVVIVGIRPGERGVFAADLASGRYGFVCLNKDPDGVQHLVKGMASEFTVA